VNELAVFIDTQLWIFAQKVPVESNFTDPSECATALKRHQKAQQFMKRQISSTRIAMTLHQLFEIYHALAFRGSKVPRERAKEYCTTLLHSKFMIWYSISSFDVEAALNRSQESGVAVWDFACVLPLYKDVSTLYTCDKHFQNTSFSALGIPIENPIDEWFVS
jgi:hypothetical protein